MNTRVAFCLALSFFFYGGDAASVTLKNNCRYTVWPGTGAGDQSLRLSTTGFELASGASNSVDVPSPWSGRFWARTGCSTASGKFVCETADCASGQVRCYDDAAIPPATLIELSVASNGGQDFYDISNVDGFNVPMSIAPRGGTGMCEPASCPANINGVCPAELQVKGSNGNDVVACKSGCLALNSSEYCQQRSKYSQIFKQQCPQAYSYAFDTENVTFTCSSSPNYAITFCGDFDPIKPVNKWENQTKKKVNRWWIWLVVGIGAPLAVPLISYFCFVFWRKYKAQVERKIKQKNILHEIGGNAMLSMVYGKAKRNKKHGNTRNEVEIFSFESIATATANFSIANKLGEGGFGPVYKGILTDGHEVAIKRLSKRSMQGLIEFKNEAKLMAKLQHTNLVRLMGFCIQRDERILVYEYMPNKSLDFYLFDASRRNALDWEKRFNIIEGIAQGLLYLHKYSRLKVIHRDLKAGNILLDEEMNPKISDFGMARIFGLRGSEENTNRVVGTYGYMSPEYAMNGIVSIKTDVFSFGVLLLEIVSGKKNNSRYDSSRPLNLIGYAWQLWNEGRALDLMDSALNEPSTPNKLLRTIHIGFLCVEDQARDRPSMLDVVSYLSNDTIQLAQPKQPAFFINDVVEEADLHNTRQEHYSINGLTVSVMDAR